MQDYAGLAKISGFTDAAFLPVRELVVVPELAMIPGKRFVMFNISIA